MYSILCQDHIAPNDIDIIDAFEGSFPDPKLAEPSEDGNMAIVRKTVADRGCAMVCNDEVQSKKRKKKKTQKKNGKKKGKKSKPSKQGKA